MNERFREIAKAANLWCIENAKGTPVAWEWEEKFAELIVQRCLEVIESEASMYNEPVWALSLFNEITEHFGVE